MTQLTGFLWFVLMLVPLIFLQRLLHREIQAIFLLITRSARITVVLFQLIFLPGVILHELSHFLMAKLLFVRTGRFSILPRPLPSGQLQMGYVEIAQVDILRASLIGAAPLITGTIFVAYAAVYPLNMQSLWNALRAGQTDFFWSELVRLPQIPLFYLWFYFAFAISGMMMPSESDRHAWLELAISVAVIFGIAVLAGGGQWMLNNIAPLVNDLLNSVAVIFGLSAAVHTILVLPIALVHRLLTRVMGMDIR